MSNNYDCNNKIEHKSKVKVKVKMYTSLKKVILLYWFAKTLTFNDKR